MIAPRQIAAPKLVLPRPDERVAIFGKTGSGKTQMAVWLLSQANFHEQPWVILDYKRDSLINSIDRIKQIGLDSVPKDPGLYLIHLDPEDGDAVNNWLRRVSDQENVGLYFDEVYEIPDSSDFRRILTQGRSKRIPAICLSQRPAFIPLFIISECEHLIAFRLQRRKDRQKLEENVDELDLSKSLPKFHSYWYSVEAEHVFKLKPVPEREVLLKRIDDRLKELEPEANRPWL